MTATVDGVHLDASLCITPTISHDDYYADSENLTNTERSRTSHESSSKVSSLATGSRDGRLVIGGVKSGDSNGPRIFLLSAVKTCVTNSTTATSNSRVSLLKQENNSFRQGKLSLWNN